MATKNIFLGLLLLFISLNAFSKVTYVIRFNDVIKSPSSVFYSELSGMGTLISSINKKNQEVHILIDGPQLTRIPVESFLKSIGINADQLIFREGLGKKNLFSYIKNLVLKTDDSFILIGSDTAKDGDYFFELKKEFGQRILKTYVHNLLNKRINGSDVAYISAYDIAYHEFEARRMTFNEVIYVYSEIEKSQIKDFIPQGYYCPKTVDTWDTYQNSLLQIYTKKIALNILDYCRRWDGR